MLGLPWEAYGRVGQCPWGTEWSAACPPNTCHPTEPWTAWVELTGTLMGRHEPASPIPGSFLSRVLGGLGWADGGTEAL